MTEGHELYAQLGWLPSTPDDFHEQLRVSVQKKELGFALQKLTGYALNINQTHQLAKIITKTLKEEANLKPLIPFSLGIVSNSTTSVIVPALIVTAARYGFALKVYEAPFGQIMQVALGSIETFENVKMDAILIAIDYKGLPVYGNSPPFDAETEVIHESLDYLNTIRKQLTRRYNVPCIVQTCPHDPESFFGSFDIQVNNTSRQFIDVFNSALVTDICGSSDFLLDIAATAETVGLANWHDPVMYNMAKFSFSQRFVPYYAERVARIIAAMRGKARRALILDLDNTLWGGVIGDDGLDGIVLGQGDATGEAHLNLQKTLLKLRERGIILAVCSKNEDATARIPFRKHPDMLLKEDHIAVFRANWLDKASNIQEIANTLGLGLDSLVFLDNDPVERDLVRYYLPQVAVPELSDDPSYYSRTLLAAGYFESIFYSDEDKNRVKDYQANLKRVSLRKTVDDLDTYLKTLKMTASMQAFDNDNISRLAQLISKSNQFNLTTRRHSRSKVESFINDDQYFTLQIRLADIFGDNGMVSIVICKKKDAEWYIDTWIMSCRVLGRRLEEAVFYEIVKAAVKDGVNRIIGDYIPSERNIIVRDHYNKLGFELLNTDESGGSTWSYRIADIPLPSLPITIK